MASVSALIDRGIARLQGNIMVRQGVLVFAATMVLNFGRLRLSRGRQPPHRRGRLRHPVRADLDGHDSGGSGQLGRPGHRALCRRVSGAPRRSAHPSPGSRRRAVLRTARARLPGRFGVPHAAGRVVFARPHLACTVGRADRRNDAAQPRAARDRARHPRLRRIRAIVRRRRRGQGRRCRAVHDAAVSRCSGAS